MVGGEIGRGGGGVWWPLEWESRDSRWLFAIFSAWQIQFAEKGKSPAPFPQSLMHRCHLYCVRQVLFHRHSFPWLARRVGQLDYRREPLIMNNQSKLFMGGGRIFISEAFKLITPSTPPLPSPPPIPASPCHPLRWGYYSFLKRCIADELAQPQSFMLQLLVMTTSIDPSSLQLAGLGCIHPWRSRRLAWEVPACSMTNPEFVRQVRVAQPPAQPIVAVQSCSVVESCLPRSTIVLLLHQVRKRSGWGHSLVHPGQQLFIFTQEEWSGCYPALRKVSCHSKLYP